VDLVAPTTPPARAHRIAKASSGFLYYIARRGVTGVQEELDADLKLVVRDLKKHAKVPVMVGFGISTPAQAKVVARVADGVIVGSALVNTVRQNKRKNYLEAVGELARGFRSALG
jgi:tryptophan synthase alpha chain